MDFLDALRFFQNKPSRQKEGLLARALQPIVGEETLADLHKDCMEVLGEEDLTWEVIYDRVVVLGALLGSDELAASVLEKYTAATGQEIKGFGAFDEEIQGRDAMMNAIDAAVHEAARAHPQADEIAAKTYQYLATEENPSEVDRAAYAAQAGEEGMAFGRNHCADDKAVLSRILQELAAEQGAVELSE